jgi:hypothetical protein
MPLTKCTLRILLELLGCDIATRSPLTAGIGGSNGYSNTPLVLTLAVEKYMTLSSTTTERLEVALNLHS